MKIEIPNLEGVFHIPEPWYIDRCEFDGKLDVYIKFRQGALFPCSGCGEEAQEVQDTADYDHVWRHLNFAEYPIYFHAEHPRTVCLNCNRILRVNVPWAVKPRAGFTVLFDAWIMAMAKEMTMSAISRLVNETDKRLWRIIDYYVDHAIAAQDLSHVTAISTMKHPPNADKITSRFLWIQKSITSFMSHQAKTLQLGKIAKNIWKPTEATPIR